MSMTDQQFESEIKKLPWGLCKELRVRDTAQREDLARYEAVLDGLPREAIDGGWTAAGISKRLKATENALARVEAERDAMEAMVSMLEEKEWAEHASKGPVSSRLETCITTLMNELSEANERADEATVSGMAYAEQRDTAQAQLAEAVGLLKHVKDWFGWGDLPESLGKLDAFLARYTQVEQREAREPEWQLSHVAIVNSQATGQISQQEAQGAQAGDERTAFRKEYDAFRQWAGSRLTARQLDLDEVGLFYDEVAGFGHDAWQARAALAAQPAAGEPIGWLRLEPDDNETASYHFYPHAVEGSAPVCFVTAPPAVANGDEAARKDAERYRWLRDEFLGDDPALIGLEPGDEEDTLNGAIDAAMRAQGDGGGA